MLPHLMVTRKLYIIIIRIFGETCLITNCILAPGIRNVMKGPATLLKTVKLSILSCDEILVLLYYAYYTILLKGILEMLYYIA